MRGPVAFLLAAVVGVVAGVLLFAFESIIGFSLIIAFPAIAGALIGGAVRVSGGQSLSTGPRVLAALVGTLIALVVYWGGTYIYYQDSIIRVVTADNAETMDESFNFSSFMTTLQVTFGAAPEGSDAADRVEILAFLREFEQEEYGTTGVPAMFALLAEEGVSISRSVSSSSGGINLTGAAAYGLWIVEALIMLGVAVGTSLKKEEAVAPAPAAA